MIRASLTSFAICVLGILGCDHNSFAQTTTPSIVEISNDFTVLENRDLNANHMSFHGVMLGSPESAAMALPHSQKFKKKDFDEIECDDLHAEFDCEHGVVTEICVLDPALKDKLNIHELKDVQMRFGKADEADVDPGDPPPLNASGHYFYFDRHIEVYLSPDTKPDSQFIAISVTLDP